MVNLLAATSVIADVIWLMETSAIIHEWFYPDGPDTFEYLLPVESFSLDHSKLLSEWILDYASLTPTEARKRFVEYLDSIALAEVSALTRVVKNLVPFSVVVHKADSWLLCKRDNQFEELSAHGNMLQLHAPHDDVEWPSSFDSERFDSLKHFLKYFGDLRIDIPPTSGILSPINIHPIYEDLETSAWKNIQNWAGSYPVYNVGNGDVVLVNPHCEFGTWCHELCNDPSGAVQDMGSFAEFLEFVANDTGIAK